MKHTSKLASQLPTVALAIALLSVGSTAVAQKTNETSAAVEFQKSQKLLGGADAEGAKKSLIKAKEYIDLAAEHADTKESAKTLFYKGEIYASFLVVGMQTGDTVFMQKAGADAFDVAIASYKKSYETSNKFDGDISNSISQMKGMLETYTQLMYTNKLYKEAVEIYDYQVKLSSALGVVDTQSYYNAGVCSEKAELWEQAASYYKKCAELGYQSPEIYKTVALCLIRGGKRDEATAYLTQAIEKNPKDPQLYYVIGSMYMETKETDKALSALRKAVELDANYLDAQYQLGAYLLDLGSELRTKANNLPLKDPNYEPYLAKSAEYYREALIPLESYIKAVPDDKSILNILVQIHRALQNTEQANAYKARLDALK